MKIGDLVWINISYGSKLGVLVDIQYDGMSNEFWYEVLWNGKMYDCAPADVIKWQRSHI